MFKNIKTKNKKDRIIKKYLISILKKIKNNYSYYIYYFIMNIL